jgi:hypothetical protein
MKDLWKAFPGRMSSTCSARHEVACRRIQLIKNPRTTARVRYDQKTKTDVVYNILVDLPPVRRLIDWRFSDEQHCPDVLNEAENAVWRLVMITADLGVVYVIVHGLLLHLNKVYRMSLQVFNKVTKTVVDLLCISYVVIFL